MHALLALYLLSHASGANSTPVVPSDGADVAISQQSSPRGGQNSPHEWGIGGQFGSGSLGSGVSVQYWIAGIVGVDTRLLLSGAEQFNGVQFAGGHSVEFAPSVIVMFKRPNASKPLDLRPYAGGGVNWTHAGPNITASGLPVDGHGQQYFGGVEFGIAQVPALGVSIEVVHTKRSSALATAGLQSNTSGVVGFRFFVK